MRWWTSSYGWEEILYDESELECLSVRGLEDGGQKKVTSWVFERLKHDKKLVTRTLRHKQKQEAKTKHWHLRLEN